MLQRPASAASGPDAAACQTPLRVGMIFLTDPSNPAQLSGMPYRMAEALRGQGVEVVPILGGDPGSRDLWARGVSRLRREARRRIPHRLRAAVDDLNAERTRRDVLRRAERLSRRVEAQLAGRRLDLLFGVCISTALYDLRTDLPVVYFSDATSPLLHRTYPALAARGRSRRAALEEVERASLSRATVAAFASPRTMRSAVEELGLDPGRASVIPMGAHVTPVDPATVTAPAEPPTPRSCRLAIVAADPVRKRVDLAVRATEALRSRGIAATLTVIGPATRLAARSGFVECAGRLRLDDPDDLHEHRRLLRGCHLQVLPSVGEAFGIAPAESAHFARPAVVSDAGGLPSVVRHDESGLVLPVEADHRAWADAIAGLVHDPDRYRRYSVAALARARDELNWSAWATRTIALMRRALAETRKENDAA